MPVQYGGGRERWETLCMPMTCSWRTNSRNETRSRTTAAKVAPDQQTQLSGVLRPGLPTTAPST